MWWVNPSGGTLPAGSRNRGVEVAKRRSHLRLAAADSWLALLLCLCLTVASKAQVAVDRERLASYLPDIPGWRLAEEPEFYDRSNLFDYIDGNCELYYSFGFKAVVSALYETVSGEGNTLVVDIYDMGSPLGAFGIYANMTNPSQEFAPIGCEAAISELQVRLWKGRYEVELNGDVDRETFLRFAEAIAARLPDCQRPEELSWLPQETCVPHSAQYRPGGILGQAFLPPGMEALCRRDSVVVRVSVARCATADSAAQFLGQLRKFRSQQPEATVQEEMGVLVVRSPQSAYLMASNCGRWLFAVSGQAPESTVRAVFLRLREHVCGRSALDAGP